MDDILTPEFVAEANENLDERVEAQAEEDAKKVVEIYDDFLTYDNGRRVLRIPQPTLGFLRLYHERREYFWDDKYGVGRLLVALKRQREGRGQYIRALRCGELIPDEEAEIEMAGVYPEDVPDYYSMIKTAESYGIDEAEKKTAKLVLGEDVGSVLREVSRSLSNLPDTPLTNLSTECTSGPSEDSSKE